MEMANTQLPKTFCDGNGHKFVAVNNAVERRDIGGNTEIYHAFICEQCGDAIQRKVAVWVKSKSQKERDEESF